jgi:CubicO group peptidase (beta-lactamase class C family)
MSLAVSHDPSELGFAPERLARIDTCFQRYIDAGQLPGWQVVVSRNGLLAHSSTAGMRDVDAGLPWTDDTLVRIYSMTKPITSVAAMMLYEEGAFELKDPVAKFIPSFADARVYRGGPTLAVVTEPVTEPLLMWHVMTHMSGLTYGWHHRHVTDELYRKAGFDWGAPEGLTLADCCDRWAELPLLFQPGTEWNYGVSTDVLGRVVEVLSGMSLDRFFDERILAPLKMVDTGFFVRDDQVDRAARLYGLHPATGKVVINPLESMARRLPDFLSGGSGLWGTAADYLRFCHMMLNRGELDGVRLLGTRTVDYMTRNHLPGGADVETIGRPLSAETMSDGVGFGLGVSVMLDPVHNRALGSAGEYAWGGAASTLFWCDPREQIAAVFMTQLLPSGTLPLRTSLKRLVYQALVD